METILPFILWLCTIATFAIVASLFGYWDIGIDHTENKMKLTPEDYAAEIERLTELNDKFMWQVRDTCTRAEKAEKRIADLEAEVERLSEQLQEINPHADLERAVVDAAIQVRQEWGAIRPETYASFSGAVAELVRERDELNHQYKAKCPPQDVLDALDAAMKYGDGMRLHDAYYAWKSATSATVSTQSETRSQTTDGERVGRNAPRPQCRTCRWDCKFHTQC